MPIEELVAAKTRLTLIDAQWETASACALIGVGVVMFFLGRLCDRRGRDEGIVCFGAAVAALLFSAALFFSATYKRQTAEAKARSDLSNYNLVELKKQ